MTYHPEDWRWDTDCHSSTISVVERTATQADKAKRRDEKKLKKKKARKVPFGFSRELA